MQRLTNTLLSLALIGCGTIEPDEGLTSDWVVQAIRVTQGRAPASANEIMAFVNTIEEASSPTVGRQLVLDALFDRPEYASYWSVVLADALEIDRVGEMGQRAACWDMPMLDSDWYPELVTHLRDADIEESFCVRPTPAGDRWLRTGPSREHPAAGRILNLFEEDASSSPSSQQDAGRLLQPSGRGTAGRSPETQDASTTTRLSRDTREPGPEPTRGDPTVFVAPQAFDAAPAGGDRYLHRDLMPEDELRQEQQVPIEPWWSEEVVDDDGAVCMPFSMYDATRAALQEDDLFAFVRGAVVPTHARHTSANISNVTKQRELAAKFFLKFTGRDPSCLPCHNATFSTTDARPRNGQWDRYHPLPWDLEGAAFAHETEEGTWIYGGDPPDLIERTRWYFRPSQYNTNADTDVLGPWGMSRACADPVEPVNFMPSSDTPPPGGLAGETLAAGLDIGDLVNVLRDGERSLYTGGASARRTVDAELCKDTSMNALCYGCHATSTGSTEDPYEPRDVAPNEAALQDILAQIHDTTLLSILQNGSKSGLMKPLALPDSCTHESVLAMVRAEVPYDPPLVPDHGDAALTVLLGAQLVSAVVEELAGRPLVLTHGQPRNEAQRDTQEHLLRLLMESGWSLQTVLSEILMSPVVGRLLPENSTQTYTLPMLTAPFAAVGPGEPSPTDAQLGNGMGDVLSRYSPNHLAHALGEALWWPRPRAHGGFSSYPTAGQMGAIGRHVRLPGDQRLPSFDTLLGWESFVQGCAKPSLVYARDVRPRNPAAAPDDILGPSGWDDWLDVLMNEADASGSTLEHVLQTVRSRLVIGASIEVSTERSLLKDAFGVSSLAVPFERNDDTEAAVRSYCSALTLTPQFQLGGIPMRSPMSRVRAPAVLCVDEACTEEDYRELYGLP